MNLLLSYPILKLEITGSVEKLIRNYQALLRHISEDTRTRKKEIADSSETLVRTYQVTQRHIPEYSNFRSLQCSQQLVFLNRMNPDHTLTLRSSEIRFHVILLRADLPRDL